MITACLCWYDEPVELLERCILSLTGSCSRLVAFDGAWEYFPHGQPRSDHAQAVMIRHAARRAGLACSVDQRDSLWPSQMEKRSAMMQAAAREDDQGWLLVIDSDETLEADSLAETLATVDEDVAAVMFRRPNGKGPLSWPTRRLFRASAGVAVEGGHGGYRAADGRWLKHPDRPEREPAADLTGVASLHHDGRARSASRLADAHEFYKRRGRLRLEVLA